MISSLACPGHAGIFNVYVGSTWILSLSVEGPPTTYSGLNWCVYQVEWYCYSELRFQIIQGSSWRLPLFPVWITSLPNVTSGLCLLKEMGINLSAYQAVSLVHRKVRWACQIYFIHNPGCQKQNQWNGLHTFKSFKIYCLVLSKLHGDLKPRWIYIAPHLLALDMHLWERHWLINMQA